MALPTAQNQITSNIIKTYIIMLFFTVFVVGIVYIFAQGWGYQGPDALGFVGIAFIAAGVMNILSYYFSDQMVLAISGAKQISVSDNRDLFHLVENLAIADGIPTPKIFILNDSAPNAFATGRDAKHASIAFTSGILQKLNKSELEGVAAHELSHIKDRDTLLSSIVAILVGFIALLADVFLRMSWFGGRRRDSKDSGGSIFFILAIVAAILSPIVATLIQLAISRRRESLADASGAYLTRDPESLAQALIKISGDPEPLEAANNATAHLYIINPFKGKEAASWIAGLFNTHPPIPDRVKALRAMEGQV